jgi:chitodextrinase
MSADPDGTIVNYAWDFGDGTIGGGMLAQHAYSATGNYTVTLYVTDNDGIVRYTSQPVEVKNMAVQWEKRIGGARVIWVAPLSRP